MKKIIYPFFLLSVAYIIFYSSDAKTIIAGIAVFLIGMIFMEDGFKLFSGGMLERALRVSTSSLPKAIGTGFLATAIVQSSSLISIIIISFLSAELITLSGAIGVVFGSNIGTTTTVWIVSAFGVKIKIAQFAMPMLIFGVIFQFRSEKSYKGFGAILIGLGFVFFGIGFMKEGFETLKNGIDLAQFAMDGYLGVAVYVLIGAIATIIIQSSSATMALIITALATNQILYFNALELAIGANIGTTVTAMLGAFASNANGKRLAVAHLIFNIITAFIAIVFLYQLADLVTYLSAKVGIASDDYAMQLALFHTIFNVIGVIVVAPFTSRLVVFLKSLFVSQERDISRARYLDDAVVEVPEVVLVALRKEIIHLYDNATEVLSHALSLHRHTYIGMGDEIEDVIESSATKIDINIDDFYERKIKILYGDILNYATIAQDTMSVEDKHKIYSLKIACRDIVETIKDVKVLQKNVNKYIDSKNRYIKNEYNYLREEIAKTLDGIHEIRKNSDDDFDVLAKIKVLEDNLNKSDIIEDGKIDKLIRNNLIETKMATSLINDSVFAYEISSNLIDVAKVVWIEDRQIQELGE
ncbi:MAG: Na/Pi symporter [Campylobacterota bacterium]|nr:Na/Pi symporter [Campylobacterota bacterium]